MFVTKNRAGDCTLFLLAVVAFVTACGPPGPRALLDGRKQLEAGRTAAAIREFKLATSLMPTNAAAWNYLGVACHRAGQVTNAVEAYLRAIKLDRDLLEARFNLGCLWLDEGKLDAAKREFTAYTLRRGNAPEGWLKLGSAQLRGREPAAAEKSFREVLRIAPSNVEAWNGLGLVELERNRPREAAAAFSEALKLQPDYRPALLNLATVSVQQLNDRPGALLRYRQYLALQPRATDWDAVNALVQSLSQPAATPTSSHPRTNQIAGSTSAVVLPTTNPAKPPATVSTARPPPAPRSETNTVAAKPTPRSTVSSVGTHSAPAPPPQPEVVKLAPEPAVKIAAPESKPAVANSNPVSKAVTPAPKTPRTRTEPAGFFSKLNPFRSHEKADGGSNSLTTTRTTASVSPVHPTTAPAPGRYAYHLPAASKAGDRAEAQVAFGQGQQSLRANRLAEALQSFRRATLLDPAYYEAYYNLGLTAFKSRSFPLALSAWENAIALRPNDADARYNFALTLKAAGYPHDAVDELEKLLSLHPDEARGHLTLGNLYADQLRDIPRARLHYHKVLQLDPRNPQAQAIRYWLVANPR